MALTSQENAFDFYLRFAKPLVLNLTEPDDRVLAAAWIQKLRDENVGDDRLRTDYLKLLLFVLQRNKLIGPFAENPNNLQQLNDIPEYKLKDVAKELLESEEQLRNKYAKDGVGECSPPYITEYSTDLLEYAAAQIIPNFGIHAYYAISNEPLSCWNRTEKAVFPRGTFSETDHIHKQRPELTESVSEPSLSPKHVKFKFEQRTVFKSPAYSSPIPPKSPRVSPSAPRSRSPPTLEGERERSPPTWGSNLIGVSDPPIKDYIPPSPLVKELMDELGMSTQEDEDQYRSTTVRFSPQRPCTDRTCHPSPSFMEGFYPPSPPSPKSPKPCGSPIIPDEFDEIFYEQEPSFMGSPFSPPPLSPRVTPSPAKSPKPSRSPIIPNEFDEIFDEQEPSFMGSPFSPTPLSPRVTPSPAKSPKPSRSPIIPNEFDEIFYEQEPSFIGSPFSPTPVSPRVTPSPAKSPKPSRSPIRPNEFDEIFDEQEPASMTSPRLSPAVRSKDIQSPVKSPQLYRSHTPSPGRSPKPHPSLILQESVDLIFDANEPCALAGPCTSPQMSPKTPIRSPKHYRSPIATQKLDDMFEQEPSPFTRYYSPASPSPKGTPVRQKSPKRYYSPIIPEGGMDDLFEEEQPSFMEVPFSPTPLSPGETWGVEETSSICIDGDVMSVGESDEFKAFDQMLDEFEREEPLGPTSTHVRTTKIPLPRGSSKIPSSSRIPQPGGSSRGIPIRKHSSKGSRIPQPGQKFKPQTTQPSVASTSLFPQEKMNAFYMKSPPPFLNDSSLESTSALEDPSLPLRTPSPRRPNKIKIEDISLTSSPYPTKPIKDLDRGSDFLETLGLSSDQLGDLMEESEPFIQEEPTPIENVLEQQEEIQESPELPRPPVLYPSSPAAQDIIDRFNKENIAKSREAEFVTMQSFQKDAFLDDIDFPEIDDTLHISERSPGATQEDISKQLRDIQEGYYQMKSTSPADAGIPVTTPRKSPLPKRPLTLHFEDDDQGFSFTIPEYQSPNPLQFELPPYYPTSPGSPASPSDFLDKFGLPKPLKYSKMKRIKRPTPSPPRSKETQIMTTITQQSPLLGQLSQIRLEETASETQPQEPKTPQRSSPKYLQQDMDDWSISELPDGETSLFEDFLDFPTSPDPIPAEGYPLPEYEDVVEIFTEEPPFDLSGELPESPVVSPRTPSPQKGRPHERPNLSPESLRAVQRCLFLREQRLMSPENHISSPESPMALRLRLYQDEDQPYEPSKITRASRAPRMRPIRELTEAYEDMDTPFLERVEASSSKIRRRRRKLDMNACHLGNVAESPIKVPTMYEVEGYVPNLPEVYPEDLIGSVMYATPTRQRYTPMDTAPPKGLPSPIRPEDTVVPGWVSPPHLKTTPMKRRQQLLPSMGENVRVPKGMRDILELEIDPSEMAYSPPPISPTEAATFKSELPQKPLQRSPPKTPPKASDRERELILEEELEPEEMMYFSPVASPKTPPSTRSSPKSPIDTPESPQTLRLRLLGTEEPEYYSKSSMPVIVGKRIIHVKRHSVKPKVHSLREVREDYPEEAMSFLSQVESSSKKFTKRMRKIKMSASKLDEIAESPVKVPNMFEADDPTGLRYQIDELLLKYKDLPPIHQEYPDDLMGSTISIEQTPVYTTMDRTPPRNLPSPIRPLADVPSWGSPQRMKTSSSRDEIPLLPGRSENLRMPKSKRDILLQESQPGDVVFSPPPLTDLEKAAMKAKFAPKSPKTPTVAPRGKEYSPQLRLTPTRTIELIEDEIFEEDLEIDNLLAETPPRQEQLPESPPESPRDLRIRLLLEDSPEYLDRPYMDVVIGGKRRRIKRHSAPPKVQSLREIREDYDEENMPFWSKVESAGKLPPKRHKRIRKTALESRIEDLSLREEPLTAPTMFEVDDTTGFRKMREAIENRWKGLPTLPQEYPEDLLGTGTGSTWQPSPSILDNQQPENLPLPLQPQRRVPGWKTPPHLKQTKVKSTSPFKVKLKPALRDILFQEMPPSEMLYSPPSPIRTSEQPLSQEIPATEMLYSPPSRIRTRRQSPVKSPTSSLMPKPSPIRSPQLSHTPPRTFEQIPLMSSVELLDDETLWEDLPYESPISREISYQLPEIREGIPKRKKLSAGDKYLARNAALDARRLLMEEESPFREPSPPPPPEKKKEIPKPKRPSARYLAQQAAIEKKKEKKPEPPLSPDQYITKREKPSTADKYVARLATREAHKLLMEEEEGGITEPTSSVKRPLGKREQDAGTPRKSTVLTERVEELIKDVGDPQFPRRPPAVTLRNQEFSLPQWSPKLPQSPTEWDVIDFDFVPEGVLNYQSPKTPPPSPQKIRTPSPKQPTPKTPPRTIFEYAEDEDFLDDTMIPYEELLDSPERPPTPPRLEDFYQVHTPPSPGDPDNLAQSLREHRYTRHRYDRPRKMMTPFVQIKNKRVPVRKSRPPKVATIEESDFERIPSERVPRKIREFPDFKPIRLEFESPPRPEKVTLPKKFTYVPGPKYKDEISYTSPPRLFRSPEPVVYEEEVVEEEETVKAQPSPNYELPRANYYGSPGREFIRTPYSQRRSPRRALGETVTITEYEYPFEDYNFPHLDTTPIQPPSNEDVAGFNWIG